ncbi:signal transduction response regulator [Deferribacter desulfuricans SSM1]|uniref:diguanylate cyclase n=2 Tax=Deferribacter TaxID=53572 RepID=D3PD66_DEFDS|nr:signal transduction response regulator [Deferribacter desulfuricans SSM1]
MMMKKILIADASKVSRILLENILSDHFEIIQFSSIAETINYLKNNSVDLLICGFELTDGNAFKLAELLKVNDIFIPILLITSDPKTISKYDAYTFGIFDILERDKIDESIIEDINEIIELYSNIDLSNSFIVAIDDSKTQLYFIENVLKQTKSKYILFENPREFIETLPHSKPDICILDVYMDELDGIEVTKIIRKYKELKNTRIIIQTSARENSLLRTLMIIGADDYIIKPYSTEELLLKIINNIKVKKINDELDKINKELFEKATTDPLTGLYNRRFIIEQLNILISNYKRYLVPFAVMILDIDHFKRINDTYGHDIGDEILINLSKILKETLRKTDIIGRFGGEEFLCLIPNTPSENLPIIISKLLNNIRKFKYKYEEDEITFTISIGCCNFTKKYKTDNEIIKCADDMLYKAKNNGRNQAFLLLDGSELNIK